MGKRLKKKEKGISVDFRGKTIKFEARSTTRLEAIRRIEFVMKLVDEKVRTLGLDAITYLDVRDVAEKSGVFELLKKLGWKEQEVEGGKMVVGKIGNRETKLIFMQDRVIYTLGERGDYDLHKVAGEIKHAKAEVKGLGVGMGERGKSEVRIWNGYKTLEVEARWRTLGDGKVAIEEEKFQATHTFEENGIDGRVLAVSYYDLEKGASIDKKTVQSREMEIGM